MSGRLLIAVVTNMYVNCKVYFNQNVPQNTISCKGFRIQLNVIMLQTHEVCLLKYISQYYKTI